MAALQVKRLSLSTWIILSVMLGIAAGMFLGEYAGRLSFIGEAFIGLLQMTVLPYITLSLIANIGKLSPTDGRRLTFYTASFLLVAIALALSMIVLLPFSLPERQGASFFSTSLLAEPTQVDFLDLFIPSNPFHSLANNIVPAVVLFCIAVGVAVITLENKRIVLDQLDLFTAALGRVNHFLVKLSPYGIFAIVASVSGTMAFDELARLKDYLIICTVAGALLGLVVLPVLLAAVTPFSYREILAVSQAPLITAFATGKVLIVLPMLVESLEELFVKHHPDPEKPVSTVRAVTPLVYPFPHAGKLLSLLFVPFAAWFVGDSVKLGDYPTLLSSGFFSLFGSPLVAIPFLLDTLRLPSDLFQLFLVSGIYVSRLGDFLGAMHIFFVSALTACAMSGMIRLEPRKIALSLLCVGALCGIVTIGTHGVLAVSSGNGYDRDELVQNMHASVNPMPHTVHRQIPETVVDPQEAALERISRTGVLRVGYHPDNLPYTFFNAQGDLVGFDIDMAHFLARQFGKGLEFVPFEFQTLADQLERGDFDVAMSGVEMLAQRLSETRFSAPYLYVTGALVVLDHRRAEFARRIDELDFEGLRVAVSRTASANELIHYALPGIEIVQIGEPRDFFESSDEGIDALVWFAENGSAWTLLYPRFSVVPLRPAIQVPLAYAVARRDEEFADFLSHIIDITRATPFDEQLYDQWILGKNAETKTPRWSVIRNVLGWVK